MPSSTAQCKFDEKSLMNFVVKNSECNPQVDVPPEANTSDDADYNYYHDDSDYDQYFDNGTTQDHEMNNNDNFKITFNSCLKKLRYELCAWNMPAKNNICQLPDQLICMAKLCQTVLEFDDDPADLAYCACFSSIIAIILQETSAKVQVTELISNVVFYQFSSCIDHTDDVYYCLEVLVLGCFYVSTVSTVDCLRYFPSICQNLAEDTEIQECVFQLHQILHDDIYESCKKGKCVSIYHDLVNAGALSLLCTLKPN